MLSQALTKLEPTDAALVNLCCGSQRQLDGPQSLTELVLRAETALQVCRLFPCDPVESA